MIGWLALRLYAAAGFVAKPVVEAMLKWRVRRGKEDPARIRERFGEAGRERPDGRLVWIHAASVGETNAVLSLIGYLHGLDLRILLTTGTVTSAAIAQRRLPEGVIHQYVPLDMARYVEPFLDHWNPQLAIFVESEIWPAILRSLKKRAVPFALVNARMSARSYRNWRRSGPVARAIMGHIAICIAQSASDARRFENLGVDHVEIAGNMKFDAPAPGVDEAALAAIRKQIGARPVFVAASTHDGEEEAVLGVHRTLRIDYPDLLTILVPRHPARGDAIAADIEAAGLVLSRRSGGGAIEHETEIFLADSLGEMGLWLRTGTMVFLGASLVRYGGHNPIEPAKIGVPMIHGPHIANFAEIFATLSDARAAIMVQDEAGLAASAAALLADAGERERLAREARACVERQVGALDRTIAALSPYIDADTGAAEKAGHA
jgi:3-deoxy-D-manno-octulosonic-acid transferase